MCALAECTMSVY